MTASNMVLMSVVLLLLAAKRVALNPLGDDAGKVSEEEAPEGQPQPLLSSPHNEAIGKDSWRNEAIGRMWRLRTEMARTPLIQFPVPDTIEQIKIDHIVEFGGSEPIRVPIGERLRVAASKADETGGFFMNQFAHADVAEEYHESGNWRQESTNILHEICSQLHERWMAEPDFFVHSAGTGATISSAGRYARRYGKKTKIVLADTEFSVYTDYILKGRFANESGASLWVSPGIAGIGYGPMGRVIQGETSSLNKEVIDEVYKVPDIASAASMKVLQELNFPGGTSSGINFLVALAFAAKYPGSTIVTPMGDSALNYASSYLNRTWMAERFGPAADSSDVQRRRKAVLEEYDCWCSVIHASLAMVQDPIAIGSRLCKPAPTRLPTPPKQKAKMPADEDKNSPNSCLTNVTGTGTDKLPARPAASPAFKQPKAAQLVKKKAASPAPVIRSPSVEGHASKYGRSTSDHDNVELRTVSVSLPSLKWQIWDICVLLVLSGVTCGVLSLLSSLQRASRPLLNFQDE